MHQAYLFFCKQKTAYEMRISDWSSDVCSSDLIVILAQEVGEIADEVAVGEAPARDVAEEADAVRLDARLPDQLDTAEQQHVVDRGKQIFPLHQRQIGVRTDEAAVLGAQARKTFVEAPRSEEHTSELQSLKRIS